MPDSDSRILQTLSDIRRALDLLHDGGWVQKRYGTNAGEHCVRGAHNTIMLQDRSSSNERYNGFDRTLYLAILQLGETHLSIEEWNDDPDTTFEDVELVFKTAIYNLESQLETSA